MRYSVKVASFFSGCGGLDLGFHQAGFNVIWANEFDSSIHETYRYNHPTTFLCEKDIRQIDTSEIPDCDGFIGGPPCQSWSIGGKNKGLEDDRGKLFLKYIEIIREKKPKFFLIENVFGILEEKHLPIFLQFISLLESAGYDVFYKNINAVNYKIPQDRQRVFIVGFLKHLKINFSFPSPIKGKISLKKAIGDLSAFPNYYNTSGRIISGDNEKFNHDVFIGAFDRKFMARNRVRSWEEVSFTIQALAKNCPLHPQAPKMRYINQNQRIFEPGFEKLYRRLSVRECARIQSFPDNFHFFYSDIRNGYKMVGNAVPPRLAKYLALSIKDALDRSNYLIEKNTLVVYYHDNHQLQKALDNRLFYIRATQCERPPFLEEIPPFILIIKQKIGILANLIPDASPQLVTRENLKKMGFRPNNQLYWLLKLGNILDSKFEGYVPKWKDKRKRTPYLDNLPLT